ncbi:MAG: hypothetical protein OSB43_20405 [Nocardioides sp.]|nr:hypothetical protein [Nocardioides sp.]MDE0778649.1 hypothetical protein [Nocardioides sp.]
MATFTRPRARGRVARRTALTRNVAASTTRATVGDVSAIVTPARAGPTTLAMLEAIPRSALAR